MFEKVIQTFLAVFDFIKLLFVKDLSYDNQTNHNILNQEINLNEKFYYIIVGCECWPIFNLMSLKSMTN